MAIKIECDGCHQGIKGDGAQRGFNLKRDYCEDCVKEIDEMLDAVDALHDELALKWGKGLAKIHKKYSVKGGLLPDVGI